MKNVIKTVFIFLLFLLAFSCTQGIDEQKSVISVVLPGTGSRGAVAPEDLSFVLTATPESKGEAAVSEGIGGETLTVEVAVGIYTVKLQAFAKTDSEHQKVLYEAVKENVSVNYKKETKISLTLVKVADTSDDPADEPENPEELLATVTINGMTVKAVEEGFEITVTHDSKNSKWDWAKVTESASGTSYDLFPVLNKLNNNESITFIYPFVTKDTEYQFAFMNNDKDVAQNCEKIKAIGGSGELDYSAFDKLKVSLSEGNYKERFINVENLTDKTTDFISGYSNIEFLFKLNSGKTDWTDTEWVAERDCAISVKTDKPELYYYKDLLAKGKFNYLDSKYEWEDLADINEKLSKRKDMFVQVGYYFSNSPTNENGRFATKEITATGTYTPVKKDGVAEISVVKAVPSFEIKGESTISLVGKDYSFRATPISGQAFNEGTEFYWSINNIDIDGTGAEIKITPANVVGLVMGKNTINCVAVYGNEIQNASFEVTVTDAHDFVDPGILLWNNNEWETLYSVSSKEIVELEDQPMGFQLFNDLGSIQQITAPIMEDCKLNSFCFDNKTGDVYLVLQKSIENTKIIAKYNPVTKKINNLYTIQTYGNVKDIAYIDDMLLINDSGILFKLNLKTGEYLDIVDSDTEEVYYNVLSVAADNGYFYILQNAEDEEKSKSTLLIKLSKDLAVVDSKTLFSIDLSSQDSLKLKLKYYNTSLLLDPIDSYVFSADMIVYDTSLYITFSKIQIDDGSNYVKSGLFRVDTSSLTPQPFSNKEYVVGWYDLSGNPISDNTIKTLDENIFLGQCKFIAIKPDVLILSEEGIYKEKRSNTNRIKKINLSDMSITSKDVNAIFSNRLGCGFVEW